MKLLELLRVHSHYWGVPHVRTRDNQVVMTCYECGREQPLRIELQGSIIAEFQIKAENQEVAA